MKNSSTQMLSNGKMARALGVDPKTLRKWARRGYIPSYINRENNYRYFFKVEVLKALKAISGASKTHVDRKKMKL